MVLEIKYVIANAAAIPGGVDPGDIRGNIAGFADFFPNFWPGTGALDCFCTQRGKIHGERPARFVTSRLS